MITELIIILTVDHDSVVTADDMFAAIGSILPGTTLIKAPEGGPIIALIEDVGTIKVAS